jgi:2'-5' RNA ligase
MRAFVAVSLGNEVKQAIGAAYSAILRQDKSLKLVDPALLHMTLYFLGEIRDSDVQRITACLQRVALQIPSFQIVIRGVGAFPTVRNPRVIWLGVDSGAAELAWLAKVTRRELEALGFPKDNKPFGAHITLARIRRERQVQPSLVEQLREVRGKIPTQSVSRIQLMESKLAPEGPAYHTVSEFKLAPADQNEGVVKDG